MFCDTFIITFYRLPLASILRVSWCTASLVPSLISLLTAAEAWGLSAVTAGTDMSPLKVKVKRQCLVWEENKLLITKPAISKLPSTAEVKCARLSLQSHLPWESLRRKIHITVGEEKRRSKFVIEHSRSHSVPVFTFPHLLHLNVESDTNLTCRLWCKQDCFSISFCNIKMYHL